MYAGENFRQRGRVCWLRTSWVLPGLSKACLAGAKPLPWTGFGGRSDLGTASHQVLWPHSSSTLKHTLNFQYIYIYTTIEVTVAVCMLKIKYMLKLAWDQGFQCFVGPGLAGASIASSCNLARAFNASRIGPKEFIFPDLESLQGNKFKGFRIFIIF